MEANAGNVLKISERRIRMEIYEREVLSVSAGKTIEFIEKYNIHAFPNNKYHNYKKFKFITFRRNKDLSKGYTGGEMENLYKVVDSTLILNPFMDDYNYIVRDKFTSSHSEYIDRLLGYIDHRLHKGEFEKKEPFKFYVLSETERIELLARPVPAKIGTRGSVYYKLSDILSGRKKIEKGY
ncbi:hypothetical protein CTDIVETGP_1714 [Clostridium tyrobutyricum DIVETGP]|uniref:Uncharacterized protein n=3 Tax=Clostridium tyrobutyricum TaxID=1519 RepID=W6N887_CLOTY|nr:hypothetical protein [Clostridium tyrobutyricum]AND85371.1 hypothetical protein CTK_C21230 [Clostridium tyrobutyricum]CDL91644.1 hypothetical protein CTDIVETGP_1714 [Clostridium tyrobutyricum DIVETGP]